MDPNGKIIESTTATDVPAPGGPSWESGRSSSFMAGVFGFLAGGTFAAFALFVLLFYTAFVAAMAYAPPGEGAWADYVEEFRLRCFQLDPGTGVMQTASVVLMLTEPLPLAGIFLVLWRGPLRRTWAGNRPAVFRSAAAALVLVGAIALSLLGFGNSGSAATPEELPFPADRLRTTLPVPAFDLVNQDGEHIRPEDLKGKVVLMTAVYSTCTKTCPMMLSKIRSVVDGLEPEQREKLAVVAFSLSPATDTRELRAATARTYGLEAPRFHFVNGMPAEMDALLDRLAVSRSRDEKTGEIMHSNLFYLIDRDGRLAYRLSLSQREQSWLGAAVRTLLDDPKP
jgi:protein SCO1